MILNIRGNRYNTKDFPLILGILNLTPDSFSDGGKYNTEYKALKKVENFLKSSNIYFERIGRTQKTYFEIENEVKIDTNDLSKINNKWYNNY